MIGDKKGRKFLGYTIGIVLFIALLPVIAIYGLFGWMSGNDAAGIIGYDAVYEKLPTEIREQIDANSAQAPYYGICILQSFLSVAVFSLHSTHRHYPLLSEFADIHTIDQFAV